MDTPCPPSPDPSTSFPARAPFYALFVPDLALTPSGDDDYFSSDLPDSDSPPTPHVHPLNKSFGTLPKPALALWSEKDEYRFLDDQRPLLQRWEAAAKGKLHTVIIKNADHSVVDEKPQKDLCDAVVDWLKNVIKA